MPTCTINGIEVPLDQGDIPAFTFSQTDLGDPTRIRGSRSKTFKVVRTNATEQALGGMSMAEDNARSVDLRIGDSGLVYYQGKVSVMSVTRDLYTLIAVGDNAGWAQSAKDTKLTALPMGTSGTITSAYQRTSWTADLADVYPLIDYGVLEFRSAGFNVATNTLRPAIRVRNILNTFFTAQGFSLDVKGALTSLWSKLVLPSTTDGVNADAASRQRNGTTFNRTPIFTPVAWPGTNTQVPTNGVLNDPSGNAIGTTTYESPTNTEVDVRLTGTFTINWQSTGVHSLFVYLYDPVNLRTLATKTFDFASNSNSHTISFNDETLFRATLDANQRATLYMATIGAIPATVSALGMAVRYDVQRMSYVNDITIDLASGLPKMTVAELITAITTMLNLRWSTDNVTGRVSVQYAEDYFRPIAEGVDLTNRTSHNILPQKEYPPTPSRYQFRYKQDKNDRNVKDYDSAHDIPYAGADIVEGGFDVPRLFETAFAATFMDIRMGLTIPVMNKDGGLTQADYYDWAPRILIFEGVTVGTWKHDGASLTDYPLCHVAHPESRDSLAFGALPEMGAQEGLVSVLWTNTLRRMRGPYLHIDTLLYDHECIDLELGKPRAVNDGYGSAWYYVQEVSERKFGVRAPVKCTYIPV